MSLSVGIVGLPNAGKSTLFNALVARRLSPTAAHPFTTIEPHEAVVRVPDENLEKLHALPGLEGAEVVPATVTFIDIAGLVKGAHEGAGLGNQFLGKIREVDAIVHVVRKFTDPNVPHPHGTINPKEDIEVVNLELEFAGIKKPMIYVYNVVEQELQKVDDRQQNVTYRGLVVAAKLEEELSDLEPQERKEYLKELGIEESGLEKLIKEAYKLLNLITFYTIKGGKEIHAWSIKNGATALDAAGVVHTDFAKNFIKAEVIRVDELLALASDPDLQFREPQGSEKGLKARRELGGWNKAKAKGKIRFEGKDYVVQDEDVIEFKTGN